MAIKDNKVTETLKNFLSSKLPATKGSKKQKFLLGVAEPKMGPEIFSATGISATCGESITELLRGIRTHFVKILKSKFNFLINIVEVEEDDIRRAQLGLGHSFSHTKCATDVNR